MGCHALSAYHDEKSGAIGFPQEIGNDLERRNQTIDYELKEVSSSHPYYIYGFNQSFIQSKIYTCILGKKQNLIYMAGRFLVVLDPISKTQKSLMHQERILDIDAKGNLCLVGLAGGRLIVWDLQFFSKKIEIMLPNGNAGISSLSLTDKYIFCTDNNLPSPYVYCYDFRTTKLRARAPINSLQYILKGMGWIINHHITIAADGVWFHRFSQSGSDFEITKGLFGKYPKTSMTSIYAVNQKFIITGSIDGYVFLWAFYKCQRVLKVEEACITSMLICNNNSLIISSILGNTKVLDYKIKEKPKTEDNQENNDDITEDFYCKVSESYKKQPIQVIIQSKLNKNLYFAQTRNGEMFSKTLSNIAYEPKTNPTYQTNKILMEFDSKAQKVFHQNSLWFIRCTNNVFILNKMSFQIQPQNLKIDSKYLASGKSFNNRTDHAMYIFLPGQQRIYYGVQNCIYVSQIVDVQASMFEIKPQDLKVKQYIKFEEEKIMSLSTFELDEKSYLLVSTNKQHKVYNMEGSQSQMLVNKNLQIDQKQLIIDLQGKQLAFYSKNNRFKLAHEKMVRKNILKMSFVHCVDEIQGIKILQSGKQLSWNENFAFIADRSK